jgi:anthranilate/para-aminobenzoate synthase component I
MKSLLEISKQHACTLFRVQDDKQFDVLFASYCRRLAQNPRLCFAEFVLTAPPEVYAVFDVSFPNVDLRVVQDEVSIDLSSIPDLAYVSNRIHETLRSVRPRSTEPAEKPSANGAGSKPAASRPCGCDMCRPTNVIQPPESERIEELTKDNARLRQVNKMVAHIVSRNAERKLERVKAELEADNAKLKEIIAAKKQKPPLGLKPRQIHDEHRYEEICAACKRYVEAGIANAIPSEWFTELIELAPKVRRLAAQGGCPSLK